MIGAELRVVPRVGSPLIDKRLKFIHSFRQDNALGGVRFLFLIAVVQFFYVIGYLFFERIVLGKTDVLRHLPFGKRASHVLRRSLCQAQLLDIDLVKDCLQLDNVLCNFEVDFFLFLFFFAGQIFCLDIRPIVKDPEILFFLELITPSREHTA